MRDVRRHFKNVTGEMVDPAQQTAAAGNKDSAADVVDERLFFDRTLE